MMRLVCSLLLLSLFTAACSSNSSKQHVQSPPDSALTARVEQQQTQIDSLQQEIAQDNAPVTAPVPELEGPNAPDDPIRQGLHNITLQWISWDRPGRATVKKTGDNLYRIDGEQRRKGDYLTIHGTLQSISPEKLRFEGTLIYRVATLNSGQPCDKSGTQEFLSTKNRKYWRMQNMTNCEGGMTTDYVDLYF
jgi:hypothetical protein